MKKKEKKQFPHDNTGEETKAKKGEKRKSLKKNTREVD